MTPKLGHGCVRDDDRSVRRAPTRDGRSRGRSFRITQSLALNFVVHGLLDGGATEARRFDKQAKALGEWLRARHVELPLALLSSDPE